MVKRVKIYLLNYFIQVEDPLLDDSQWGRGRKVVGAVASLEMLCCHAFVAI